MGRWERKSWQLSPAHLDDWGVFRNIHYLWSVNQPEMMKTTFSGSWWDFVLRIDLIIGIGKTNVVVDYTGLKVANKDRLYLINTNSLNRIILVSFPGRFSKSVLYLPKAFRSGNAWDVEEPSIGEFDGEESATLVYLRRRKAGYPPRKG